MPHDSKYDKKNASPFIHQASALAFPICSDDKISSALCASVSCVSSICCRRKYSRNANVIAKHSVFPPSVCEVHDQKYSGSGEHIDLSVLQTQTGPDKVVITVGGVYTIT